jgi:hypothetical protein
LSPKSNNPESKIFKKKKAKVLRLELAQGHQPRTSGVEF